MRNPTPQHIETNIFTKLFSVLEQRKTQSPDSSYVAGLYARGTVAINDKIREEAVEVCAAGLTTDKAHITHEICDLIFHSLVLAAHKDIGLSDIAAEFVKRFGVSGLAEKGLRKKT